MKALFLSFVLVVCGLAGKLPAFQFEDGIAIINNTNFGAAIQANIYSIFLFYDPQDTGFQNVKAEFIKTFEKVSEVFPGIKFCKMNAAVYKSYAQNYASSKLPSINIFFQGDNQPFNYTGVFNSIDIFNWVQTVIDDTLFEVNSIDEVQKYLAEHENVAFFLGSPNSKAYSSFRSVSTIYGDIFYIWSNEKNVKDTYGAQKDTYILFRQKNTERNNFQGPFEIKALSNFTRTYKHPSVMALNRTAGQRIFEGKETAIFLIRPSKGKEGDDAQKEFVAIANEFRSRIALTIGAIEDNIGGQIAPYFGATNSNIPMIAILDYDNQQKRYRLDREINSKNIRTFLFNFFAGNLNPYLRSAQIPTQELSSDGKIKIVVGKTWKDIVLDPSKDVLIEFYSPSCLVCQNFAPTYWELSQKLFKIKDLIIAKIDGSTNDIESHPLLAFPALFLYPKNAKQNSIEYVGDRSLNDIVQFLQKNLKNKKISL